MNWHQRKIITVTREELYNEIWTTPILQLSKKYGLSDQGLAKKCKKHNIPTPPVGYWQKLKHGKNPKKTPLPKESSAELQVVEFEIKTDSDAQNQILISQVPENDARLETAKTYQIPAEVKRYSPLVKVYRDNISFKRADSHGFLYPNYQAEPVLDIKVSKNTYARSCLFMQGLIELFGKLKWSVSVEKAKFQKGNATLVTIGEEQLCIKLKEKINRITNYRSLEQIKKAKETYDYSWQKYSYETTGILNLTIENVRGNKGAKTSWSDNKKGTLESQLVNIIENFIKAADVHKAERLEREERAHRWEQESKERQERERLKRIDEKQTEFLIKVAERWNKSQVLSEFVEHLQISMNKNQLEEHQLWIEWIKTKIKELDPANNISKIIKIHEDIGDNVYLSID